MLFRSFIKTFIYSVKSDVFLALHSPNSLPKIDEGVKFTKIKYGNKFVRISYSRVETRLLGSGFDTNCFDYDLDHKFPNYNMRSDCITSCLRRNYSCPDDKLVIPQYLLRREFIAHNANIKMNLCKLNISPKDVNNLMRNEFQCLQECKKDCKFTRFITNSEFDDNHPKSSIYIELIVSHNQLPDTLITHLPETTFNAFVYNFGGLLGLGNNRCQKLSKTSNKLWLEKLLKI